MEIISLICIISNSRVKYSTSDIFLRIKKKDYPPIIISLAEITIFFKKSL